MAVKTLREFCADYVVNRLLAPHSYSNHLSYQRRFLNQRLQNLPEDVLVSILENVQDKQILCDNVLETLLCSNLRTIHLQVILSESSEQESKNTLHNNKPISDRIFYKIPSRVPGIQRFIVQKGHELTTESMSLILEKCIYLQVLELRALEDCDLLRKGAIPVCTQLHKLELISCKGVTGDSLCTLSQTCFSHLTSLSVKGCSCLSEFALIQMIQNAGANLRRLVLADCEETTDGVVHYVAHCCPNLSILNISWCEKVTDASLLELCQHCNYIEVFKCRNIQSITDTGVCAILNKYGSQLRSLDLSFCSGLQYSSLDAIAEYCGGLKKLYLSWIFACEDHHVTRILYECHNLQKLQLEGCKSLTFQGVECLTYTPDTESYIMAPKQYQGLPACAKTLELLDLSWCNSFTAEILRTIVDKHPDMTVLDYYSQRVLAE